MHTIIPHLWFNTEAKEATALYTSLFPNSKIISATTLHNTPSGDSDVVSFELAGQRFMAISAGPYFTFTPAISLHVKCKTKEEVDTLWEKLSPGGKALMELGTYPFSERYGWLQDRYGLSWQLMYVGDREITQTITPVLMFVGKVCGQAEEAVKRYTSVFSKQDTQGTTKIQTIMRYGKGEGPDPEGTVKYADFSLLGMQFGAMDSAHNHQFTFNEAISFIVPCETQEEIDYYWNELSAVPASEQCGWLKDKFGVSWQITPKILGTLLADKDPAKVERVTQAFLAMKKLDIAQLQKAYDGQ